MKSSTKNISLKASLCDQQMNEMM